MKKGLFLSVLFALTALFSASAQEQHAHWSTSLEQIEDDLYRVSVTAVVDPTWHIYDTVRTEFGPNATIVEFTIADDRRAEKVGDMNISATPHKYYDDIYMMEIGYFEDTVTFYQDIRLKKKNAQVDIFVEWMACDDTNCLPLADQEFSVGIPDDSAVITAAEDAVSAGKSIWGLIIEAILWGFAALLTPCVFPMVPMTVSYFLKGEGGAAKGRLRAAMYGIFIVALYTLPIAIIIVVTRIVGGDAVTADIFNWLATHWLPNIIFFIVFMIFAASFFGAFEITMPSKLVNKSDSKADTKGFGGIFFLALTLVLVSFSCTGPIVGSVLIKSTQGEFWTPIITMLAFSIAFALPFTIFALFPSMLKKLPKSGGWLNTVKVVIAFIEVALGFKFLSVADQTYHWGILDREVYLAIWIVVFTLLGFYLLGKIKFAHDDDVKHIGVGRLTLVIAVFAFVVYMIPGMWGAPLKALSGYLPPLTTQDFVLGSEASVVQIIKTDGAQDDDTDFQAGAPKYSDFLHLPHGLQGFFELNEARAYSEKVGKPLFIDFTGHGCVNCREMEARVWSDPRVLEILRNDYVIVALYCDDKKQADQSDWITDGNRTLKTIGKINSHIAYTNYGVNAQPCYVLEGHGGEMLAAPRSYNLDVDDFVRFLEGGLEAYNK
ncbi:MAG TPA: thioredoxin family protein [Candidatus Coprenecus stercoravium]|uniref:Thioredoxin family protein n=1 Tax=Candidatus Coprenecus stercoravium TaxID=2840735 RepID=A0A9D2KA75_9BACT|nr:thioredoxin family protein [Candidatus Coprenecus stercoravium]